MEGKRDAIERVNPNELIIVFQVIKQSFLISNLEIGHKMIMHMNLTEVLFTFLKELLW